MIYLLDDKDKRQCDYGWTKEQFEKYKDTIIPIYKYSQLSDGRNVELFQPRNIVLFHESFFDVKNNEGNKDGLILRERLNEYADSHQMQVAYFSGSKNGCGIKDNIAYLPVENLYRHLECFVKMVNLNQFDWRYLLYGEDPLIEENLITRQRAKLDEDYDENLIHNNGSVLIFQSSEYALDIVSDNCVSYDLFPDSIDINVLDKCLDNIVFEDLNKEKYDKLIIPLCFGPTLCDCNGLRLATHIRCSDIVNRTTPIYIYGIMNFSYLLGHSCFDILKTDKVQLIDFDYNVIINTINQQEEDLDKERLSIEMRKMHMDIPQNYNDNHSIANEWALYRWVKAIGEEHFTEENASEVLRVLKNVKVNLYFKYLDTIYPSKELDTLTHIQYDFGIEKEYQNINNAFSVTIPRVLYIDDEYLKWGPLFQHFMTINKIQFSCYEYDFKRNNQSELIQSCLKKIIEEHINIVILDFRLLLSDFGADVSKTDVTGYKLLEAIKNQNAGIQVLVFSATNKVWNWQMLQDAGANGFIIKESPQNSIDQSFTTKTIDTFCRSINSAIRNRFTYDYYNDCTAILKNISNIRRDNVDCEYKVFLEELSSQILSLKESVKLLNRNKLLSIDIIALNFYNILDQFKKIYYDSFEQDREDGLKIGVEGVPFILYKYDVDERRLKKADRDETQSIGIFQYIVALYKDYFRGEYFSKFGCVLNIVTKKRNNYIHSRLNDKGEKIVEHLEYEDLMNLLYVVKELTRKMKE